MQTFLIGTGYQIVNLFAGPRVTFMNYGYAWPTPREARTAELPAARESSLRVERPAPLLQPADESNRYGIQLYQRVLADTDLRGRDVLEVSCGRGGACSYMARYCGPRQVTGIDLASRAVAFCREHHRYRGLRFITGDSERLPVPRSSIDVVVKVEASHCYPSGERFLAEVRRVPGVTRSSRPDFRLSSTRSSRRALSLRWTERLPQR